jgi:hypothetical protein
MKASPSKLPATSRILFQSLSTAFNLFQQHWPLMKTALNLAKGGSSAKE